LKILHGNGFSDEERVQFRKQIMNNIVDSIRALVNGMEVLQIQFQDPNNKSYAEKVVANFERGPDGSIPEPIVRGITELWADQGIQACYNRSNEFLIQDTANYFLDDVLRFTDPSYVPTDDDILRARTVTDDINENRFLIDDLVYRIYDVPGMRTYRLAWAPYFEGNVDAVMFVSSLAAYDQMLVEDTTVNRMVDALQLFEKISSNPLLQVTSLILFLNKTDLFKKKIRRSPISKYFPDYDGDQEEDRVKAAGRYFKKKFHSLNSNPSRKIYTHFTTGTDTVHMKVIITAVRDIITRLALKTSKMIL
ncbi:hypothetical protein HK102_009763, partial [Quaeritorhiza haematococci]